MMVSRPGQGPRHYVQSVKDKVKNVTKNFNILEYSALKTNNREALGNQRAKPRKIKA